MHNIYVRTLMTAAFVPLFALSLVARPAYNPGPALDEQGIDAVAKIVSPCVVRVEAHNGMHKIATGVIVDKDGYVITTALISPRDEEITVITADGKRIKADFVGLDGQTRVAVLKAKEKLPAAIAMGKVEGLAPGAWVGVVGLSPENTPAVTQGIISSVAPDWLRLNVWVVRGSSGSPVVNKDGQMIGLLRGAYFEDRPLIFEFHEQQVVGSGYAFNRAEAPASGMAQAVPIDVVKDVYAQIRAKGKVERGWLGVSVQENDQGQAVIVDVEDDSPASLSKLKEGDIILKLDGKAIIGPAVLSSEIRKRKPGNDIVLQILRGGKTMDVKVKLGTFSQEDARLEIERSFPQLFRSPAPLPEKGPLPPGAPKGERPKAGPMFPQRVPPNIIWEKRKFIGLYLSETTKELAEFFGLKDGVGLLVVRFSEDSAAQKAGLKVGDVVFKADGKRVQTVQELSVLLQEKKKGDKVKLEFIRDKKSLSAEVEVGEEESQGTFDIPEELLSKEPGLLSPDRLSSLSKILSDYPFEIKKLSEEMKKQMDLAKSRVEMPKAVRLTFKEAYRI
jgi:serine protease Do